MSIQSPGPDVQVCAATHDGVVCGGPMSLPIRSRRRTMTGGGLWLRTCRRCFSTTLTGKAPEDKPRQDGPGRPIETMSTSAYVRNRLEPVAVPADLFSAGRSQAKGTR